MTLPHPLRAAIDEIVGGADRRRVEQAARRLSDAYRAGGAGAERAARTTDDVAAYLAVRAPATYAAALAVFRHVQAVRPGWSPSSLLDLGAGPGIASWAALAAWPGIRNVALVEAESAMAVAGRVLATVAPPALRDATWTLGDARSADRPAADLVVASYLLGELPPDGAADFVARAWNATTDVLVIVEPGTTGGYERVLAARSDVLRAGGFTVAPCPHDDGCPLAPGDWCHFGVRLPRSRTHRAVKEAERGFEDEKVAYVALARERVEPPHARIIRRPELHPGHVVLTLCTRGGVERRTVTRSEKDAYREARRRSWGDELA